MPESVRMWVEIGFNITYLIIVWGLVIAMIVNRDRVAPEDRRAAGLVTWAFALLALGDTGHVGFRVLAYSLGSLETTVVVFRYQIGLVGFGALSTAITVTVFYMLMVALWRERFDQKYGWFGNLLLGAGIFRLAFLLLPLNDWSSVVPPQPWSTVRNLPLMLMGLGVAYLILRDGRRAGDRTFTWIGIMILVSYACYIPVILFVQQAPLVGMLMIPKTIAYVAIGFLAYIDMFRVKETKPVEAVGQPST